MLVACLVPAQSRALLDNCLSYEWPQDTQAPQKTYSDRQRPALFATCGRGGHLCRQDVGQVLKAIGAAAGVSVGPHILRHTSGARMWQVSRSESETAAALGHCSLNYVGRYTRLSDDERDALAEDAATL